MLAFAGWRVLIGLLPEGESDQGVLETAEAALVGSQAEAGMRGNEVGASGLVVVISPEVFEIFQEICVAGFRVIGGGFEPGGEDQVGPVLVVTINQGDRVFAVPGVLREAKAVGF